MTVIETQADLQPGPAMDQAVGERMGAEPVWQIRDPVLRSWECSQFYSTQSAAEEDLERWRSTPGAYRGEYAARCVVTPVYPAYSTSSAWEQVADWLETQGHFCRMESGRRTREAGPDGLYRLFISHQGVEGVGLTRAEAVCRAVLALPRGEGR